MIRAVKYAAWYSLDHSIRYSLVDTMALVDLHRRSLDSVTGMEDAVGDSILTVMPDIMVEAATKCRELGDYSWSTLEEFERSMVERLDEFGAPYSMAAPSDDIIRDARIQYAKGDYPNRHGDPLSAVDCTLLCAAASTGNVDVVTADGKLAEAVTKRCGDGRAHSSRVNYYRRRRSTAQFVGNVSGLDVKWNESGTVLEYADANGPVIILDTSGVEAAVVACSMASKPEAAEAIRTFFMVAIQYGVCQCGSDGSGPFRCRCPEFPYPADGGLGDEESSAYLNSLKFREWDKLQSLVKSF